MSDATTTKTGYKQTLNLPKTDFPMRANLGQNEPQSQKRWEEMDLYRRVVEARRGDPAYIFHDGPPYANAGIHVGHLLNKVLKDIVVRTRALAGFQCRYVPGWDCHGLPIEHKVMQELAAKGRLEKLNQLSEDDRRMAIRRDCRKYAEKYVNLQASQLKRLSTLADYDDPYLTMSPQYEQAVLEVFAALIERGLVYRALKSVHWSIANQTALAEAELEYYDREDTSVYALFDLVDPSRLRLSHVASSTDTDGPVALMIWTTTPWTLPANLAVAVHPDYEYGLYGFDLNRRKKWVLIARERSPHVLPFCCGTPPQVEFAGYVKGSDLIGSTYKHPFLDDRRMRKVVAADYVTLEDGTGLVHTAPGHGEEDYQTGLREGLDIYCPVLEDGRYDDTVPQWLRGVNIWDANEKIVEHLRTSGHLFYSHPFVHSYPHDWRGKTPVIFRATEQWFVDVNKAFDAREAKAHGSESVGFRNASLRDRALAATEKYMRFIPEWGRNRMRGMLESRPDWCLSRQRSWGLPIPAFANDDGEMFLTPASVRAVARVVGEKGSDAWFTEPVEELLKYYEVENDPDAPEWAPKADGKRSVGVINGLKKTYDIFDVWFESGSSWNAVLRARDLGYPADLYLEGSDQHRGWFQLSLLPALGVTGVSPFRALLTHGFMVDKDGRKMSKSLGNALEVEDLLKDFGADVCRWWVSSLAFENDIKVDPEFFQKAGESYRKVRNTLRFLLGNLFDFDPSRQLHQWTESDRTSMDAWAILELGRLIDAVSKRYESFSFRNAHELLYTFCNYHMSAVYLSSVKDRLYCDGAHSERRRRTQTALFEIADALIRLLAPFVPHTADEAWLALRRGAGTSVHLEKFPVEVSFLGGGLEAWNLVFNARDQALKALEEAKSGGVENPLDAGLIVPDPDGELSRFEPEFADLCGVSRARFDSTIAEIAVEDLRNEPRCDRCWKRTGDTRPRSDGGTLCDRCAAAVQ